jgi:hypothetical protein
MQLFLPVNILQDDINFIFEPQIEGPITLLKHQIFLIIQFLEIIRSFEMKIDSSGSPDHNVQPFPDSCFLMSDILPAHEQPRYNPREKSCKVIQDFLHLDTQFPSWADDHHIDTIFTANVYFVL